MNEMMIFSNPEFGNVRTVMIDDNPWFVGIDVAKALGYAKPNEAIRTNTNKEDTSINSYLNRKYSNNSLKLITLIL